MGVLQLLAQDNFITYSKVVARKYGVNSAILLGALCSYQNSFKNQEFYKEQEKIKEDTCLSKYEIQQALKVLVEAGIVKVIKKGLPAKNYYYIFDDKLSKILTTSDKEIKPQEVEKLDHINNNNTINKNTNNNSNIIAEQVITYLNEKAGTHFKPVDSNIKFIKARLKDYTKEDLEAVIDKKVKEWKGTEMQMYLRPETLFNATKFESYINGLATAGAKQNFIHNNYTKEQINNLYSNLDEIEV